MLEPPQTGARSTLHTLLEVVRARSVEPNHPDLVKELDTPCCSYNALVREGTRRFDVLEQPRTRAHACRAGKVTFSLGAPPWP